MNFKIYGPYVIPRGNKGLVVDQHKIDDFWEDIESNEKGLTTACGCYVLAAQRSGGSRATPWYIGKAERRKFSTEALSDDKIRKLNYMLDNEIRAKPVLFLLAQVTPGGKFRKPATANSVRKAIGALESLLIGMAIKRNPDLINISGTKMFRDLKVDGFLNSKPLARGGAGKKLRDAFGI